MTKTCPQQINQRSHRHRDPMVQGDGKDALSVWKIAEKVCDDFCCTFLEILTTKKCMLELCTYNVIYACLLQRVRARDVQFHRRHHLRRAAKRKQGNSQESKKSYLFHPSMSMNIQLAEREPDVPLHLLQNLRNTILLLQRQVHYLEILNNLCT